MKKKIKTSLKNILNVLPYVRTLHRLNSNSHFPAGHFYSTVVSIDDIRERQDLIWKKELPDKINGIDLQREEQIVLLEKLVKFFEEMPFPEEPGNSVKYRYNFNNTYYNYFDGAILYSMLRYFRPNRIIEVGSGFSSANILDTNDHFFNNSIEVTFIEPFPDDRLFALLSEADRKKNRILINKIQEVPLPTFQELEKGDILFVDSSHSVKTGSDVNHILFEILPCLKSGVLIHFHDIFFPFEYPKEWVLSGFGWNEAYFLRSFLMYNRDFKIRLFNNYIQTSESSIVDRYPLIKKRVGSALWLEKI